MPRPRTGQIKTRNGKFIARIRWKDTTGKLREKWRTAATRTEARNLIRVLWSEVEQERARADETITFDALAAAYLTERAIPAVYVGERKVAGMRAHASVVCEVETLRAHFGPRPLSSITYTDLERFKAVRLATPTRRGARNITSVNHELRRLNTMFVFALQKRWLTVNPFAHGASLISAADETARTRPRGDGEEEKLLALCTGRRAYLRLIIILAIDTAARRGEILGLRRRDVDLDARLIRLPQTITKTARARVVPISERLAAELRGWFYFLPDNPDGLIFDGIKAGSVSIIFQKLCRKAGIVGLRLHDLRAWAITDMVNAATASGIAPQHVMRISGHSSEANFRRYIRTDDELIARVREAVEVMKSAKTASKREPKGEQATGENSQPTAPSPKLRKIK